MGTNKVRVSFDALPENQGLARSIVCAYLAAKDPTIDEMTEVKTAVSEAVSNAIIHAYEGRGEGIIELEMEFADRDTLAVKVTDYGRGIKDVEKAREPMFSTIEGVDASGMGFTVMESFMDKVIVKSEVNGGTAVTLIKKLDIYDGN